MRRNPPSRKGASAVSRRGSDSEERPLMGDALRALDRGTGQLLAIRQPDGHWVGELEGDTILESEYALLRHFMGNLDADRLRKLANYLRQQQLPAGGWALYPGGK